MNKIIIFFLLITSTAFSSESFIVYESDQIRFFKQFVSIKINEELGRTDRFVNGFLKEDMKRVIRNNYKWDVEPRKMLMYFYEAFYGNSKKGEYLSITVAQPFKKERPYGISFTLPNSVKKERGLFIAFCKTGSEIQSGNVVTFAECKNKTCKVRFKDCILKTINREYKSDLLELMMTNDEICFAFYDKEKLRTVIIPLLSFQEQYRNYVKFQRSKGWLE